MPSALENKNVVLGVSLSNKLFSKRFCIRLCNFIIESNPKDVLIFLGDEIEIVNYTVFGKKSMEDAKHTSVTRGLSLARMLVKGLRPIEKTDTLLNIRLESELRQSIFYGPDIQGIQRSLTRLMNTNSIFRDDVHSQVKHNLKGREEKFGSRFVDNNLDELSLYVIGELAVFLAIFGKLNSVVEIYPGENLFIKERLIDGAYPKIRNVNYSIDYSFVDISSLSN